MLDLFRRHDAYKYPERTDDNLKMTLLQNAVGGVPDLDEVKGQLQIHAAMHGFEPTYDKYVALLKSTASQNDKRIKLHSRSKKAAFKVEVNEHEFDYDKDQDGEDEEDAFYDADDGDTIKVNKHDLIEAMRSVNKSRFKGPYRPMMGKDRWEQLKDADKQAWDNLSDEAKSVILGHRKPESVSANKTEITESEPPDESQAPNDESDDAAEKLFAMAMQAAKPKPGNVNRLMSSKGKPSKAPKRKANSPHVTYNVSTHKITYQVSSHKQDDQQGTLIDRGANGCVTGADMRVIAETDRIVDVTGVNNHQATDLKIVSAGGVVKSNRGELIAIVHQSAHMPNVNKSILASPQLESYGNEVNEGSIKTGGRQRIVTPEGHIIPIDITNGLPNTPMRPFTDEEFDTLPHVILTADENWDPRVNDHKISDGDTYYDAMETHSEVIDQSPFDEVGNLKDYPVIGKQDESEDLGDHQPEVFRHEVVDQDDQNGHELPVEESSLEESETSSRCCNSGQDPSVDSFWSS